MEGTVDFHLAIDTCDKLGGAIVGCDFCADLFLIPHIERRASDFCAIIELLAQR
jgi:hypothetical protein